MFQKIESNKIYINILNQIKNGIKNGDIKKGDKLPSERELSATLGVSRPAIREAMKGLELIGLVESKHGEGNFISSDTNKSLTEPMSLMFYLNQSELIELVELRRALEIEAVRVLANKITDDTIIKLQEYIDIMGSNSSETEKAKADRDFHYLIAEKSGNSFINNILNSSSDLIDELIKESRNTLIQNDYNTGINTHHNEILQALRKRQYKGNKGYGKPSKPCT